MAASHSFFDELVESLRHVPFGRLPEVAAAIRGTPAARASTPAGGARAKGAAATGGPALTAEAFAHAIVSAPGKGSKLDVVIRAVIVHALEQTDGNVSAAARLLGVERKALERKIRRYRLR